MSNDNTPLLLLQIASNAIVERDKLIDEVNALRALLATKNEALNNSAKRIFDLESELAGKKEKIRGLEIELQMKKEALEGLESVAYRSEVPKRECNHLWRAAYVTTTPIKPSRPIWKCECCGEEMTR